jgi:hypothetical protein
MAIVLAPFAEAAHRCLIYEAFGPPEIPVSEYYYIEVGVEDIGLIDGSVTGEEYKSRLSELMMSEHVVEYEEFQSRIVELASMNIPGGIRPPLGPDGTPAPPPMKLPPGPQQQPNPWRPVPGSPTRPDKWIPTYRCRIPMEVSPVVAGILSKGIGM